MLRRKARQLNALALVLGLAACSGKGSGGGSDADGSMEDGGSVDGGNGGNTNGGKSDANTGGDMDANTGGGLDANGGGNGDANGGGTTGGTTGDGGNTTGDGGGGSDGGVDSGMVLTTFDCPGAGTLISASAGGTVSSGDVSLSIPAGKLATDTTVTLCKVPADKVPAAVTADGPVGDVYYVEPASLSISGAITFSLNDLTSLTQGTDGTAPVLPRLYLGEGSPSSAGGAVMSFAASPVTVSGSIASSGFVYLRHLDASGARYAIKLDRPTQDHGTGEVFDLKTKVKVLGTPAVTRTLALLEAGCDIETIAPHGADQPHTDEACGELGPVLRAGADLDGTDGALGAGRVVDLTDEDANYPPPRFFCNFGGTGLARVTLAFKQGTDTELSVVQEQSIHCKLDNVDLVQASNFVIGTRLQWGPIITSVAPTGAPLPNDFVAFTSDAYKGQLGAVGTDGVYYKGVAASTRSDKPAATLTLGAPQNSATYADTDGYLVPAYAQTPLDSLEPALEPNKANRQYFSDAGGTLNVQGPSGSPIAVSAAALSNLDVQFGEPLGGNTVVSFKDGVANVVYLRGVIKSGSGLGATLSDDGFVRFMRVRDMDLANGRRSFVVLPDELTQIVATAGLNNISHFRIGFLNVVWDKTRKLWPNGRVVPVGAGVVYEVSSSRLSSPKVKGPCDDVSTDPDPVTNCRAGKNQTLLVAMGGSVHKFSPVDGSYLGKLIDVGAGPDGIVHIVQNELDHCLYASQHTTSNGEGIWRYNQAGELLSQTAYYTSAGLTPEGMENSGPLLFVANGQGGVVVIHTHSDAAAPRPGPNALPAIASALKAKSLVANINGDLYVSNVATGGADGTISRIPSAGNTASDYQTGFTRPAQVSLDMAGTPNLLVAVSGDRKLVAYNFASNTAIRTLPDVYSTSGQEPVGIWALLNDKWMVAGKGIGVDLLTPGTHVRTPSNASDTAPIASGDASQISSVCLP